MPWRCAIPPAAGCWRPNRDPHQGANLNLEGFGEQAAGVMLIGETPGGRFRSEHLAWRGGRLLLPPLSVFARLWVVGPGCDAHLSLGSD